MSTNAKRMTLASSPHRRDSTAAATFAIASSGGSVNKMSFGNLSELLLQLLGDRDMYESYYHQKVSFEVELSAPYWKSVFFNIVRAAKQTTVQLSGSKSQTKKSKKKYEYFTSTFFGSPTQGHQTTDKNPLLVACQIHPDLLALCFEVSATEARALQKTDKKRCNSITFIGGVVVRNAYFGPRAWTAALYLSPDEVFCNDRTPEERLQDLQQPVLLLECEPPPPV
jgi:hypothetical protein